MIFFLLVGSGAVVLLNRSVVITFILLLNLGKLNLPTSLA
nr:MAG TPA: hypothetical protein [Herelleviridae sp.]